MSEDQDSRKDEEASVGVTTDVPSTGTSAGKQMSNEGIKTEGTTSTNVNKIASQEGAGTFNDIDGDSEAETLIESPEKKRNIIDSAPLLQPSQRHASATIIASAPKHEVQSRKRKRSVNDAHAHSHSSMDSRPSSPLSSPITRPYSDGSESDRSNSKKTRKEERSRGRRNGAREYTADSEENVDTPRTRPRHSIDASAGSSSKKERQTTDNGERRETRSATYPRHSDNERSPSPQPSIKREHRRGVSTQLTTHEFERKRRGRPPLISTQRHRSVERTRSPESDRSNSPAPQRSALSKLTSQDQDTMSPIKTGPKKRRDKNGRTPVARHANSGNLDLVKTELAEHREDLNLADNAGNTPLQIAALEGHVDIVEYLLIQGCEVNTRNIDKDTPLIDAVENGHVEVVKLLLDHDADPRLGNAKGDEPYELVPDDDDNYEEIRRLLAQAKDRTATRNRGQEQPDANNRDGNSSRAASAASPRDSPPVGPRSPPSFSSRRRTGRSESTRNDLLWQAHNQPTLAKLAAKGDVQGVANILNSLQKAETESLIAAAKAGHEEVLQHLLAMGDPDPDPSPVKSLPPGFNTPLLAAIGRGHVDVVKLLISQSGFDPTRKLYGKYYYELARDRRGADWQHEYEVLKSAFERFGTGRGRKQSSPRKTRDLEKARARVLRRSSSPVSQKRSSLSPTMTHKLLPSKSADTSPREKRKVLETVEKRRTSGGRTDGAESSTAITSDLEQTVTIHKQGHRSRRSQSDLPALKSIDSEAPYRRRRLMTGKEHRRQKSSAPESGSDEDEVADMIVIKMEDRPVSTLKRTRSNQSIDMKSVDESEKSRIAGKKRRTVESSPEEGRTLPPRAKSPAATRKTSGGNDSFGIQSGADLKHKVRTNIPSNAKAGADVEMQDAEPAKPQHETRDSKTNIQSSSEAKTLEQNPTVDDEMHVDTKEESVSAEEITAAPVIGGDENKAAIDPSEEKKSEQDAAAKAEADAAAAVAAAEAETRAKEEAERQRAAAEAAEKAAAEKAMAEEAEKQAAADREAAKRRAEEEEARQEKKRAEEEAARRKEEEDRQEQKRREHEQRRRQQDLENEKKRLAKLPATLSKTAILLNDDDPLAKEEQWLKEKYLPLFTVTTRQLDPHCSDVTAEDQWVPNYQVAGLLATKDLNLRAYTSIEKRQANVHERNRLWGVSRLQLSFDYLMNWGLGISHEESIQRERDNREKFMAMDEVFWVKLGDFQDQVPRYPHLAPIKLQTQAISLKTWTDVLNDTSGDKSPKLPTKLTNGIHTSNTTLSSSV